LPKATERIYGYSRAKLLDVFLLFQKFYACENDFDRVLVVATLELALQIVLPLQVAERFAWNFGD
jgi:hypothetical protein